MDKWHTEFDPESDTRLIKYLAREKHVTPFFHPQIQLRITAPIFVARQWFRSTVGAARSEISRRYVDSAPEFFVPSTWRARPEGSIKQGSGGDLDAENQVRAAGAYGRALGACQSAYDHLIKMGVAPEQARMILPQSMMTTWIETGSLAYWARFYGLRADCHAQLEIQRCAEMVAQIIEPLFPVSWEALTDAH
jgi:thymidylate synthase (FAD)